MARKPNYKFERMERDRAKAAKKAEKQRAKREKSDQAKADDDAPATEPASGEADR